MKITPTEAQWIHEYVKKIDFLKFLTSPQISAFIQMLTPRLLQGQQPVIKEGRKGDCFFLIYNGRASVWVERNGKRSKLATLSRGDFFGEISLLTGNLTTANVIAKGPTKVFMLNSKEFLTLVRSNKKFTQHVIKVMQLRLRQRKKALEALQYGNMKEINEAIKGFLKATSRPKSSD